MGGTGHGVDRAELCYMHRHRQWYQEVPVGSHIQPHRHTVVGETKEIAEYVDSIVVSNQTFNNYNNP